MENTEHSLKHGIRDYIETKIDIARLNLVDKSSSAISGAILGVILFLLGLFVLAFLSFTVAYAISEAIGRAWSGFLIVTGFYALVGVAIFLLKEKLIALPVVNALLQKVYKKRD